MSTTFENGSFLAASVTNRVVRVEFSPDRSLHKSKKKVGKEVEKKKEKKANPAPVVRLVLCPGIT